MFFRLLLSFCPFSFGHYIRLFFFDLRILITPLVSSKLFLLVNFLPAEYLVYYFNFIPSDKKIRISCVYSFPRKYFSKALWTFRLTLHDLFLSWKLLSVFIIICWRWKRFCCTVSDFSISKILENNIRKCYLFEVIKGSVDHCLNFLQVTLL